MSVFFAFSDESGKYKKDRSQKFISKNPFYCRSVVFLQAEEWLRMRKNYFNLKENFLHIHPEQEVKWSYIWSLYKHFQKKEKILPSKPYYGLRRIPLDNLVDFIRRALHLLHNSSSCRILLTLTFNQREKTNPLEIKEVLRLHLSHFLELGEKEMEEEAENICVLFFSPEEPWVEKQIKKALRELYGKGPPFQYSRLKDSFDFEISPYSFGSQLADYCAGVFNGCCRYYPQSIDLFRNQIWPKLIRKDNKVVGYGITEIPKNQHTRKYLKEILKKVWSVQEKDYRVNIEDRLKSRK